MPRRAHMLSVALLLAGCGAGEGDSLRLYTRNPAADEYGIEVGSLPWQSSSWSRVGGTGCQTVDSGWQLSIGPAGQEGRATGTYTTIFGDDDLGPEPVVWIDIAPDGTVSWGEGQPAWADQAAPDTCGPAG